MSFNPTVLEIDSAAIDYNLNYFKLKIQSQTKILVVIKAYSYGGDSTIIAKILEQQKVDYLAVSYTDEGIALRKSHIKLPILVLHPQVENFELVIAYNLEPNLYNFRTLEHFTRIAELKNLIKYPVHIKLNTGMNRLGFQEVDILKLQSALKDLKNIEIKSIYSHFASSEDKNESNFTNQQINSFIRMSNLLKITLPYSPLLHISNTAGILNYPNSQFDIVRLGIGLYGFGNDPKETSKLKNVYCLKTKLSQILFLKKGETVGYNRKFSAKKDTKIGIIPIGYADGLNRNLSNAIGSVYIKDQKIPIVGTISMGITTIDITGVDCAEGDEVIIFNHQDHILELANKTNTISYEILTSISQRVKRRVV